MSIDAIVLALVERFGETGAHALIGLALGGAFGALALLTRFCTRAMVAEWVTGSSGSQRGVWAIAFAVARVSVQALLALDLLYVAETRFFGTPQSVSGAVIGGAVFGIGMALARGCASRLLVLGAAGNLRAMATVAVIGITAWLTIQGPLAPLRDAFGGIVSTAQLGGNDALALVGLPAAAGVALGVAALVGAGIVARRIRLSVPLTAGATLLGLVVPAGWLALYALSGQVFDPIQVESVSFVRPLASTASLASEASAWLGFDTALVAGTLSGAFLAALVTRRFRIEAFGAPGAVHPLRYLTGGIAMGFGGVLAVGCTVGAGFTGGSVLALTGLLALAAMIGAAAATIATLERLPRAEIGHARLEAAE